MVVILAAHVQDFVQQVQQQSREVGVKVGDGALKVLTGHQLVHMLRHHLSNSVDMG